MQASSSRERHGAFEAIEDLAEEVLKIYLHCPALGKAGGSGKTVMALYLEAQDLLDTRPQAALWTAERGLKLATDLLAELDTAPGSGRASQASSHSNGRAVRIVDGRMTDGDARLLSGEAHDLLERLVDAGATPRIGIRGGLDLGMSFHDLPPGLGEQISRCRQEVEQLLVWDTGEAWALIGEAYRFVFDRWRPGVREPAGTRLLWSQGLDAAAREDMGTLRVLVRRWVAAHVEEMCQAGLRSPVLRPILRIVPDDRGRSEASLHADGIAATNPGKGAG